MTRCAIAIHGGCGVAAPADLPAESWAGAKAALADALRAGWAVLTRGGPALDAVQAAVEVLEDSPHFNAGHGAALNAAGEHELDAAIMDGATLRAGSVAGTRRIRNPVQAARALLEQEGGPLMLIGPAADAFAGRQGLVLVEPDYFGTARRRRSLDIMKAHARAGTDHPVSEADRHGTVGAVALDRQGHLAAATSTGGFTNKAEGRVGDSPIIGAGTYARDGVCAVSGTGQGEYFIRHVLGHEIASRMAYRGDTLEQAAGQLVLEELAPYGIGAGAIAIDREGRIATPFNTEGMFRGWVTVEGDLVVATHDELLSIGRLA